MQYLVQLTGSRHFKSAHYLELVPGALVTVRSRKSATRMSFDKASTIAANWSDPNGFSASVIAA